MLSYTYTHTHTFLLYLLCVHIYVCVHAIVFNKISYVQLTKRRVHCFNISKQYILQLKDFGKNKNTIVEVQIAWKGTLGVRIVVQNRERECLSLFSFVYMFFCFYKDLIWFLKKHTEWKRSKIKEKCKGNSIWIFKHGMSLMPFLKYVVFKLRHLS